jgi:hypothetical protein
MDDIGTVVGERCILEGYIRSIPMRNFLNKTNINPTHFE